jgi:isoquinoline 1-oxidoreductase beta subunit
MLARADFIKIAGVAGAGFAIGLRPNIASAATGADAVFTPNVWLSMDPAGVVTVMVNKSEMGQGIATSLPMMVAEELDAPMSAIRYQFAPADAKYNDPVWKQQATGGSTTSPNMYVTMRTAGATARAMLVSAAAARWAVDPSTLTTKDGIVSGPGGKTATYASLAADAAKLDVPANVALKSPDKFRIIGTPVKRLDLVPKTNGTAVYGIDVKVPGMLIGSIEKPPVLGGSVASFDATKAKKVKGVRHVVQVSSGVAVIGDHMWAVKQGRAALSIKWNPGPYAKQSTASIEALHRAAFDTVGVEQSVAGDAKAAMAGKKVLKAVYEVPYLAHAPMEPMNATADVRADRVEIWAPTQAQTNAQAAAAKVAGVPVSAVTLHTTFLGGGFGRRFETDFIVDAVEASKAVGKPVKLVWTREDDIRHGVYRSGQMSSLQGTVANGKVDALTHHVACSSILARIAPGAGTATGKDRISVSGAMSPDVAIPNSRVAFTHIDAAVPVGFWRAPGANANTFAVESFLDELAHEAGQDPVAFRRAMMPTASRARKLLDIVADRSKWTSEPPKGHARGVAVVEWDSALVAIVAEVSMPDKKSIRIHKLTCAADCGMILNPDGLQAQLQSGMLYGLSAALSGKITIKDGGVVQSNFYDYEVLRMKDAPEMDITMVTSSDKPTGAGEVGTPAVAPAVANALFKLTGKRYRKLPFLDAIKTA